MNAKVIEVRNLTFTYPDAKDRTILDIPAFALNAGEHTFLHGPSGSGKTTFLGLLAGILETKKGFVKVMGHDLGSLSTHERDLMRGADLGYIFQMFNLIPYLSVRENILLPLKISPQRRARTGHNPDDAVLELASHLRIEPFLDRPVTTLSVGQQQRVAAARALIGHPGVIIADEPTSALDMDHRHYFLELLFKEAERGGSTVLFVSHDHSLKPLFKRVVSLEEINHAALPHREL